MVRFPVCLSGVYKVPEFLSLLVWSPPQPVAGTPPALYHVQWRGWLRLPSCPPSPPIPSAPHPWWAFVTASSSPPLLPGASPLSAIAAATSSTPHPRPTSAPHPRPNSPPGLPPSPTDLRHVRLSDGPSHGRGAQRRRARAELPPQPRDR